LQAVHIDQRRSGFRYEVRIFHTTNDPKGPRSPSPDPQATRANSASQQPGALSLPPNYWKFVAGAACHLSLATAWLTSRFNEIGGLAREHRTSVSTIRPRRARYESKYEPCSLASQQDYLPKPTGRTDRWHDISPGYRRDDRGGMPMSHIYRRMFSLGSLIVPWASNCGWKTRVTHESAGFRQQV
jgi:hypothetical protein